MIHVALAAESRQRVLFLRLFLAAALVFSLIQASMGQPGGEPRGGPRVLKFWAVTGSVDDVTMFNRLAQEFERREGIHVEVTPLAWGNFETKYFAAMAAGMPPDAGATNLGGPFNYGSVGGLVDLRKLQRETGRPLESLYPERILGMFEVGKQLFGVPADLSTVVLCYRTDIFAQLGLTAPKTWSDLNRVIGTLEAHGYRYYFNFTEGSQWALSLYTQPFGLPGIEMNAQGRPDIDWERPQYQDGVMEALKLWNLHNSPGKDLNSKAIGMFRSSDPSIAVPLIIDQHTIADQIAKNAPEIAGKWDVAPWPKADDGRAYDVMGGDAYVIFRRSKMNREAYDWIRYLSSQSVQEQLVLDRMNRGDESSLTIPSANSMWAPSADGFWDSPQMQSTRKLHAVLQQIVPTFRNVPSLPGSVEVGRLEQDLLDSMATFCEDSLNAIADRDGITRNQLIQDFGAGKRADEKQKLEADLRAKLADGYKTIAPQARTILRDEAYRYANTFGKMIPRLPELEKQADAMTVVKWMALVVFIAAIVAVCVAPELRKRWISYAFVAPPMILALGFVFIPAGVALYLSFTRYHPVLPLSTAQYVGLDNYRESVASGDVLSAIARTFRYALLTVPVGVVLSLGLAYLLNTPLRGERYWRFVYFSPLVTSVVSIALIFYQLFLGSQQGWLNALLLKLGLVRDPIPFLTSEHTFLNCVVILAIWQGLAFTILVFLAGLQQIPSQLYEAAAIDGAGPGRRFWNVAVPGLRPQIFFTTVLGVIGSFQVFETIYTLAGKSGDAGARFGPNDSALTMVPLIYHTGFETFEMGKSASIAYLLFALILIMTFVQLKVYKKVEG
jgi:ABC-type sugar transport system permease subunit/ABC-type glycerol-3-phosphate transport system substrate-binding protein